MKTIKWTIESIAAGFEKFIQEHGRLPTAHEVDNYSYLPSSRFIQIKFDGLRKLREKLGYKDFDFGSGKNRSKIAHRANERGRSVEIELEAKLIKHFGEVFVHTEKIFNDHKTRVDYYIYSPSGNFGVDIFYPDNFKTLQSNANIKIKKYKDFPVTLYYAVANKELSQDQLDNYSQSRKERIPNNQKLITLENLLTLVNKMSIYENPLKIGRRLAQPPNP